MLTSGRPHCQRQGLRRANSWGSTIEAVHPRPGGEASLLLDCKGHRKLVQAPHAYRDDLGHYYATRKVVVVRTKGGAEEFAEDIIAQCIGAWVHELLNLGIIDALPRIPASPRRWMSRADVPERPCIEMRGEQGEYFESRPILLSYDQTLDRYLPLGGKSGSIQVAVKLIVTPSRFTGTQDS
jgi:hypothetical protein